MPTYYLIPSTSGDPQLLVAGGGAISGAIQPAATERVLRYWIHSSKKSKVYLQHSKTPSGPWVSHNPVTGIDLDTTEKELYYWLEPGMYGRVYIINNDVVDEEVKVWASTDADYAYCRPSGVFRATGLSVSDIPHSDVVAACVRASSEVDLMTQRIWSSRSITETFNGDNGPTYFTRSYPISSVTSLSIKGSAITVSYLAVNNDNGRVMLDRSQAVEEGSFYVSVDGYEYNTITYVAGPSTTPPYIVSLAECLAGLKVIAELTGGIYDKVTNFSLGSRSMTSGEPYQKLSASASRLKEQADKILANIPKGWWVEQ